MTKVCQRCGAEYQPQSWNSLYCTACSIWMRHHPAQWREEKKRLEIQRPKKLGGYGTTQCALCGKTIIRRSTAQKYCESCAHLSSERKEKLRAKRRKAMPQKLGIPEITALARAAGMSYGRYVAAGMPEVTK